jgi:hypothetical protein
MGESGTVLPVSTAADRLRKASPTGRDRGQAPARDGLCWPYSRVLLWDLAP